MKSGLSDQRKQSSLHFDAQQQSHADAFGNPGVSAIEFGERDRGSRPCGCWELGPWGECDACAGRETRSVSCDGAGECFDAPASERNCSACPYACDKCTAVATLVRPPCATPTCVGQAETVPCEPEEACPWEVPRGGGRQSRGGHAYAQRIGHRIAVSGSSKAVSFVLGVSGVSACETTAARIAGRGLGVGGVRAALRARARLELEQRRKRGSLTARHGARLLRSVLQHPTS